VPCRRPRCSWRAFAEEAKAPQLPPDFRKLPEDQQEVKMTPPPENSAQVIAPTPNVLAALELMKKMTFVEFIAFGALLRLALALVLASIAPRGAIIIITYY